MPQKLFKVTKNGGESEFFLPEKLKNSLLRAGASEMSADRITGHIQEELKDGMRTSTIYRHAFELLRQAEPGVAARYDLKKAILRLGPSGYPFEKFMGRLFEHLGYKTNTGVIIRGHCIEHEVDVIAENEDEVLMMECKYHNYHDTNSDVKTALYVKSRMDDLKEGYQVQHPGSKKMFKGYLVTNTKVSSMALRYAECSGLNIISWSYPKGHGLAQLIDQAGLHPVTCLTTLTEIQIKELLNEGRVLCKDVPSFLEHYHLAPEVKSKIIEEVQAVCALPKGEKILVPA